MTELDLYIDYLEEQHRNHSIYVWSAQGEGYGTITADWIRSKETSAQNAANDIATWKKACKEGYEKVLRAFDCSGLGMYYFGKRFGDKDRTADDMYNTMCDPITKSDLKRGDWVFKQNSAGKKTHVGYIVDDNLHVIEAKGRKYGVTKSELSDTKWNAFGRPIRFKKDIDSEEDTFIVYRVLRVGCKGDDVKQLQERLIARGFYCGHWGANGSYGSATEAAVRNFQKYTWPKFPKEWDGIAGRRTLTAIGAVCKW